MGLIIGEALQKFKLCLTFYVVHIMKQVTVFFPPSSEHTFH